MLLLESNACGTDGEPLRAPQGWTAVPFGVGSASKRSVQCYPNRYKNESPREQRRICFPRTPRILRGRRRRRSRMLTIQVAVAGHDASAERQPQIDQPGAPSQPHRSAKKDRYDRGQACMRDQQDSNGWINIEFTLYRRIRDRPDGDN